VARALLRTLGLVVLAVSFVGGFAAAIRVVQLQRVVVARFEGRSFLVPSRVYSAPAIVYPGLDWKLVDLPAILRRLGYREAMRARDLTPGQYAWGPHHARVHLRAFEHPSRSEPARDVVLRLDGNLVSDIRAIPSGAELGVVALEPEQIGAYYGPDREQRELVSIGEVPRHLIEAIYAVEDQRFETHPGLDLRRIAGALVANLRAGSIKEGGSTLTQQLVKNFFLTPERTWSRKFQEAVMAVLVELRYEKPQILEAYLNEIYLGQRGSTAVHGVGEAARLYFGKKTRDLTLAESALLAAIIQSPNGISPHRARERATQRRNLVLGLMHSQARIDAGELERARAEPIQLSDVTPDPGDARYFLDLVRRHLAESYDADVLAREGLRIYSTLDRRVQLIAARALREGLADLEQRFRRLRAESGRSLQGCIVALRPQTGEILALVGGRDYRVSQYDRCTQARRPTGSVFKPFVYIAALEPRGGAPAITLASIVDDSPFEVSTPSGPWRPENYDHEYHGRVGVRAALEHSYNVATARLADQIGVARVADVARRLGITSPLPRVPSLALGTADVAPIEMVRAYATIASGGIRPEVQSVEDLVDARGHTLERRRLHVERVLDAGTAFLATSLLEGVALRGTAAGVHATGLTGPVAAKTGTSDEEHDLWFVGFTPDLVALVWVGFDEPKSLGIPSSVGALPIWRRLVTELSGGRVRGRFSPPAGVTLAEVEPSTGMLALEDCPERRSEYFVEGTLPTATCPSSGLASPLVDGDESPLVRRRFFEWLRGQL
jgi:penicillin-binding protein 1B